MCAAQVLLKVITPYTRIRISFIAQELNITPAEVEQLLVALILDGQVCAYTALATAACDHTLEDSQGAQRTAAACPRSTACAPPPHSHPARCASVPVADACLMRRLQIDGHIDQLDQLLLLNEKSGDAKKYHAVDKWGRQLAQLQQTVFSKLN